MNVPQSVCIVTPGALGSNPRVVKEAQALHEYGYNVTVISTRTNAIVDHLDSDILRTAQWQSVRIDLRSRGDRGIHRAIQYTYATAYWRTGIDYFCDKGLSYLCRPLIAAATRVRADVYVAHYPAALPAVAMAASRFGARYAFDAEDYYLEDLMTPTSNTFEQRMIHSIEARYLNGCAYVTACSPGVARAYEQEYSITPPTVILNVFPKSHAPQQPTPKGDAPLGPSVYWFSQTVGPNRGLECAVQAIARAKSQPHLYLRGTSAAGFSDNLKSIAANSGAAERVHFLPPAAPSQLERLGSSYDVGLVSETGHTLNRRIALTNKLFSYLLGGVPPILSDIPAHREFARDAGDAVRLFAVDDVAGLANVLDGIFTSPKELESAREMAFRLGQTRYNWDVEKSRLLALVAACVARRGRD